MENHAERMKALSQGLIEAQEAERRRAARELHDEIGQALTAVKDEFVVFAMENEGFDMDILTRRIQQAVDAANAAPDHPFTLSLSIGIARFDPQNPRSLDALLAESDSLMYENKQKKRIKPPVGSLSESSGR